MHVTGPDRHRRAGSAAAIVVALAAVCSARAAGAADATAGTAPPPDAAPSASQPAPEGAELSKAECLERYEGAQVARRERRLLDSRAALRVCSGAACPSAIRADCVDWLDQVSHSIPSVVVTA